MAELDPDGPAAPDSGIFGLDDRPEDAGVVLVPVPYDATTSYGAGAAAGPEAILKASHQLDLYDVETGRPYSAGIVMLDPDPEVVDLQRAARRRVEEDRLTAAPVLDDAGARVEAITYRAVSSWLARGKLVGVVGGDHSVPLGAIRAHGDHFGPFGILHIDAHADLRAAYEGFTFSHASIMERVLHTVPQVERLAQVAIRDLCEAEAETIDADPRIQAWFDPDLARARLQARLLEVFDEVVASLPAQVYVSFDIDGLDPRFCPGTGTPVPGGLTLGEVSLLLGAVVASGRRVIGFDLTEVAPGVGEWDGNVGARALYKLIGWALRSREDA